MINESEEVRFAVKALPASGARPNELTHTMAPHPLVYQELPYDPEFLLYNHRLTAMRLSNSTPDEAYWRVRRQVILRHTGELALEVRGPDAARMLDHVFPRDVGAMKVDRCSYQFACYDDGGMITDGVLMRLAPDRFWFGQADGDLFSWLKANARGFDADVIDPGVWISQVQGPDALKVLAAAVDGDYPERFRYFDIATVRIAGQPVTLSRTGFTNELGWEFYLAPDIDVRAVGDRILEAGSPYGLVPTSADGFRARRIEAGLLNAGTDFDASVTPFAAGLGAFVDLAKSDFVGKAALEVADRRCRTWGLRVPEEVARLGESLSRDGAPAGRVCSTAWSPFQRCGVAIVRLDDPEMGPGTALDVECNDGVTRTGVTCTMPMYDEKREIPRGKRVDIPEIPGAAETHASARGASA